MTSDLARPPRKASRRWRTTRWLITLTLLITIGMLAPASAAHALDTATCTGSSTISYNPGLTLTPQNLAYSETDAFSSCVSTITGLTSGSAATGTIPTNASCLTAPAVYTDPAFTITWNTGQHSVITLTYTDVIIAGTEQVTATGTITSGPFAGGNATIIWVYPVINLLQCLASPEVTTLNGTLLAQITLL